MARRRIHVVAAAVAASLLAASCSGSGHGFSLHPFDTTSSTVPSAASTTTSTSVPGAKVAPVGWAPCHGSAGPAGYLCATVPVPRNPADPSVGGTIGMAVARRPATGQKLGSLLIDPGGPGGSGVDFLGDFAPALDAKVLQHFDVIGFDPPGVDRTAPITCLDGPGLDRYFAYPPIPADAGQLAAYVAEDKAFAAGCQAMSGAELPYVSTVDAAMDMDVLRADLGDPKLTYLGFSYGTFLGATYANLFPDRVRAMVLDGALDPSLPVIKSLEEQAAGFDSDLRDALQACQAKSSCPWKPSGDPVAAFQHLVAQVTSQPLSVPGTARTVGPAILLNGTALTLYDTSDWKYLYDALALASQGNGSDFLQLSDDYTERNSDGTYGNLLEAFTAVNCLDQPAPSIADIQAALPGARQVAPVYGPSNLYSEVQCDEWPVPPTGTVGPIHADGSPPIVVVGTTGDPATPYPDAEALASQLRHGVLLTRVGDGHTAYQYSSCIRGYVDSYLVDLTVPGAGIRCPTK
jgi:pimeloyl-ACP methyl ester carboxylesterase